METTSEAGMVGLYEDCGGTLYIARDGDAVAYDITHTQFNVSFREHAEQLLEGERWPEMEAQLSAEEIAADADNVEDWTLCRVAEYDGQTRQVQVLGSPGAAATNYLGPDNPGTED